MAICVMCKYCIDFLEGERLKCDNSNLPKTDFVRGIRYCDDLNPKGDCKGFKPQVKTESIYETKEDEEMARIHRRMDAPTD